MHKERIDRDGKVGPVQRDKERYSKPAQEETDSNQLSDPGQPTADTADPVSVIAIDDPFLITNECAFVLIFEISEIDMDIYGQTQVELCERYQITPDALPSGITPGPE